MTPRQSTAEQAKAHVEKRMEALLLLQKMVSANTIDAVTILVEALAAREREVIESIAQFVEGGNFIHENAPDARFAKACAAGIRQQAKEIKS